MSKPAAVWKADLVLAFIALIWGSTFVVVKSALAGASTMLFLTLRFALAALALAVLFRGHFTGSGKNLRRTVRGGAAAGLVLIASYYFQTQGLRYTTPSKSAFITGLSVVLVPMLAALAYRTAPGLSEVAGVLTATVGMALMTIRWEDLRIDKGDALTLACAFGFAIHILMVGRYTRAGSFEVLSFTQIATAALAGGLSFWWMETPRLVWSASLAGALAVTALLATALAFTAMAWAQQHTSATHTALIFSLEPVFAWFTSWLWEGETLGRTAAVGAGLILAGILTVELKPFGRASHPTKIEGTAGSV